jgi:hypothetical protein
MLPTGEPAGSSAHHAARCRSPRNRRPVPHVSSRRSRLAFFRLLSMKPAHWKKIDPWQVRDHIKPGAVEAWQGSVQSFCNRRNFPHTRRARLSCIYAGTTVHRSNENSFPMRSSGRRRCSRVSSPLPQATLASRSIMMEGYAFSSRSADPVHRMGISEPFSSVGGFAAADAKTLADRRRSPRAWFFSRDRRRSASDRPADSHCRLTSILLVSSLKSPRSDASDV